ncbi:succinyldiaminopimelate transaminase [Actinophytocola sediminis]
MSRSLPSFPWDSLASAKASAGEHPDGLIDLSVGTPVDPVPPLVQQALQAVAAEPGYPTTHGTPRLRAAAAGAMARRHGVTVSPTDVLPTIGSKELVAWLPTLLALGPADTVVIPALAYPTYEVGIRLAGASVLRTDGLFAAGPLRPALVWINSPANPTGQVLPVEHLRKVVDWARERGAVVAADECYLTLSYGTEQPHSILHPDVCGGRFDGLLAVHSLSKSSSLAGYRAGFVTGDPALVERLLASRKHAGMIVPLPVQSAMTAALSDDTHVEAQRARFAARRTVLMAALTGAGFRIDHSTAGLYLWASRDEPAWDTVRWFAERGILVAPGTFYGPTGDRHVRVALTAPDDRVARVASRLT